MIGHMENSELYKKFPVGSYIKHTTDYGSELIMQVHHIENENIVVMSYNSKEHFNSYHWRQCERLSKKHKIYRKSKLERVLNEI